jgi:hypothetical protein
LGWLGATEESINVYKNACATECCFGDEGRFGSISALLVNQPVVLYFELNVQDIMEEGNSLEHSLRLKEVHQCI